MPKAFRPQHKARIRPTVRQGFPTGAGLQKCSNCRWEPRHVFANVWQLYRIDNPSWYLCFLFLANILKQKGGAGHFGGTWGKGCVSAPPGLKQRKSLGYIISLVTTGLYVGILPSTANDSGYWLPMMPFVLVALRFMHSWRERSTAPCLSGWATPILCQQRHFYFSCLNCMSSFVEGNTAPS